MTYGKFTFFDLKGLLNITFFTDFKFDNRTFSKGMEMCKCDLLPNTHILIFCFLFLPFFFSDDTIIYEATGCSTLEGNSFNWYNWTRLVGLCSEENCNKKAYRNFEKSFELHKSFDIHNPPNYFETNNDADYPNKRNNWLRHNDDNDLGIHACK